MASTKFSKVKWGDGLSVTDEGEGVIRVDGSGGVAGPEGPAGPVGPAGPGVAAGGTAGQVLEKNSSTDYDTHWVTPSGGGGGAPTGPAGGVLSGTYPNPGFAVDMATQAELDALVQWEDTGGGPGSGIDLDDLGDVQVPSPADGDVLSWDVGASLWGPRSVVGQTLADAKGDMLAAPGADSFSKLPVGSNGQVLTADSAQTLGVKWSTIAGGGMVADTLWDAKGDLAVASAADTGGRLAVGSNGQVLTADSAQTLGVRWATPSAGAAGALTLLSTTTLSGTGAIDVSSISGSYNDLILVLIARSTHSAAADTLTLIFNNDTGTNYSWEAFYGQGSTATAVRVAANATLQVANFPASTATANLFGVLEVTIPGYASTTWLKAAHWGGLAATGNGATAMVSDRSAGYWASTAAINRVKFSTTNSGAFVIGSTLRIYGRT